MSKRGRDSGEYVPSEDGNDDDFMSLEYSDDEDSDKNGRGTKRTRAVPVNEEHPVFGLQEMVGEIVKNGTLRPVQLLDMLLVSKTTMAPGVRAVLKDPEYWRRAYHAHFGHTIWASAFDQLLAVARQPDFAEYVAAVYQRVGTALERDPSTRSILQASPLEVEMARYSATARMAFVTAMNYLGSHILHEYGSRNEVRYNNGNTKKLKFATIESVGYAEDADFMATKEIGKNDTYAFAAHLYDMVSGHWDTFHPSPEEQARIWEKKPVASMMMACAVGLVFPETGPTTPARFIVHGSHDVAVDRMAIDQTEETIDVRHESYSPTPGVTMFLSSTLRVYHDLLTPGSYRVERTIALHHVSVANCGFIDTMLIAPKRMPDWPARIFSRYRIPVDPVASLQAFYVSNLSNMRARGEIVPVYEAEELASLTTALVELRRLATGAKIPSLRTVIDALPHLSDAMAQKLIYGLNAWDATLADLGDRLEGKRNAEGMPNMYRAPVLPSRLAACAVCAGPEPSHVDPVAQRAYCARCVRQLDA